MPNPPLPHRFREDQFRRYEPHITEIVASFPNPQRYTPTSVAQVTFACRLRDAITSLRNNQWKTTVNLAQFLQVVDEIVVSEKPDGTVVVGDRETIRDTTPAGGLARWATPQNTGPSITIDHAVGWDTFKQQVEAAVLLQHFRLIPWPITIVASSANDHVTHLFTALENSYDVAFHWRDALTCILT